MSDQPLKLCFEINKNCFCIKTNALFPDRETEKERKREKKEREREKGKRENVER